MNLVALYRGESIGDVRIVAVSADPGLIADVASRILSKSSETTDPVLAARNAGVRKALRLVLKESKDSEAGIGGLKRGLRCSQ
ncbi:MAG: hypothetical protein M1370_07405 [Bacteroidetes bacterium]|nr:hypothetical protein [Bacteroidota bacterium]